MIKEDDDSGNLKNFGLPKLRDAESTALEQASADTLSRATSDIEDHEARGLDDRDTFLDCSGNETQAKLVFNESLNQINN